MNFKKYLYFKDGKLFWLPRDESEFVSHKDFFEACCARRSIENRLGYDENHGRKREARAA